METPKSERTDDQKSNQRRRTNPDPPPSSPPSGSSLFGVIRDNLSKFLQITGFRLRDLCTKGLSE